jgi:hypothetical protein
MGKLYVSLLDQGLDVLESAMFGLQARWLVSVHGDDALVLKRRIAEELLMGAYDRKVEWPKFKSALDRTRALGFSNDERRIHVACLFARWAHERGEHEAEAQAEMEEAGRLVAGLSEPMRTELHESVTVTRADTARPRNR